MKVESNFFNEHNVLNHIRHFLPHQSPLKDFVHHNTLHAFQDKDFFRAAREARVIFGYKTTLSLLEYRNLYKNGKIAEAIIDKILIDQFGSESCSIWKEKMLSSTHEELYQSRIGGLRRFWKELYSIDLDLKIHGFLFRLLSTYFDQGITIWKFPLHEDGFLATIRTIENSSIAGFFKSPRAKRLLNNKDTQIGDLLQILVGKESLYEHYLFDQQFAHPGWSGMVAMIEGHSHSLLDGRKISLEEFVIFECLYEIDVLDQKFGENWLPLGLRIEKFHSKLFSPVDNSEYYELLRLWQESFEWTYYDQVLAGIQQKPENFVTHTSDCNFQAIFCIDDRSGSLRRYLEEESDNIKTFGTPGFFGAAFYYQPMDGKFFEKSCPAPLPATHLIKEVSNVKKAQKDFHFSSSSYSLLFGWLITHSIGFLSAFRLFLNIFSPKATPANTLSFKHMDKFSLLTLEHEGTNEHGLKVGFDLEEMTDIVEGVLKSIGLVEGFSKIVYVVGHGASSVNNTHYAGYDCGACSGRPGSVNARVFCHMANSAQVRDRLKSRGVVIGPEVIFLSGLHDTTRDEIEFYDDHFADVNLTRLHTRNKEIFGKALQKNAKERARRLYDLQSYPDDKSIHDQMKKRSISLFEPRPELNHATNALCVVGRREMTSHLFLDRRAFMNSYDYSLDPSGEYLFKILSAATPVCGGINLEYFFSRVDNTKLGAGTKLPHNVMGLIGVANGIDGDLRTGLPKQMIEQHDPLRLLMIVEHYENVILDVISKSSQLYEWYYNDWVKLVVVNPITKETSIFQKGIFMHYQPVSSPEIVDDLEKQILTAKENLPVLIISKH